MKKDGESIKTLQRGQKDKKSSVHIENGSQMKSQETKTACVIQGNIRQGFPQILSEITKHFDVVILSMWENEREKLLAGNYEVVLSKEPENPGYTHRNYQRVGTYAGIVRAMDLGCTHVLKWRTDMLPTKLDVTQLLHWSKYKVPAGFSSRVVTCSFRNLTVEPDWFSSIPDLFAFADIEMMKLLWGVEGFDFSKSMNVPEEMILECGTDWLTEPNHSETFCAESELYAHFKNRLQKKVGSNLGHRKIATNFMRLIDHRRLGICWFAADKSFRSIPQALELPWWTEKIWDQGNPKVIGKGYPKRFFSRQVWRFLKRLVIRREVWQQNRWYQDFQIRGSH